MKPLLSVAAIGLLFCVNGISAENKNQEIADMIFIGGKIFTSDKEQTWAEAMAIKDGKFIYVGDTAGLSNYRSDRTDSIDLKGRLVIPGLVDSHAHPGYVGVEQLADITGSSEQEMLAAVKKYAQAHPDDDWLRLCCWPVGWYVKGNQGPHRQILDAVVPNRPVWFVSEWWHSGWLNSKALAVLGEGVTSGAPERRSDAWASSRTGGPHHAQGP